MRVRRLSFRFANEGERTRTRRMVSRLPVNRIVSPKSGAKVSSTRLARKGMRAGRDKSLVFG